MNPIQVSVVLPCLNEASSVALVVRQAFEGLEAAGMSGEVVVADNGSSDGSPELAAAAGARVITVPVRGYGAALAAGFVAARGEICVMGDADATYPFERLGELVAPVLKGEADMVIGSRWVGDAARHMPLLHRFLGTPVLSWLVRRAGGPVGVSDSQSGFRAFRRARLLELGLRTTGMEYASEMLIVAGRARWRIAELPTGYRERIGESKLDTLRDGVRHLQTILLLAPNLAATLPGVVLSLAGSVGLLWWLLDPSATRAGSPAWLASVIGPAAFVVGVEAVLVGLLLAATTPLGRDSRALSPTLLLRSYLLGGAWALLVGLVVCGVLAGAWLAGLPVPARAAQIGTIALVLVLVGALGIGTAVLGALLSASRRHAQGDALPLGATPEQAA